MNSQKMHLLSGAHVISGNLRKSEDVDDLYHHHLTIYLSYYDLVSVFQHAEHDDMFCLIINIYNIIHLIFIIRKITFRDSQAKGCMFLSKFPLPPHPHINTLIFKS